MMNALSLCGTDLVFEDDTCMYAEKTLESVAKMFGLDNEIKDLIEKDCYCVSKIRDNLLETIEEVLNVNIKTVYDYY